MGRNSMRIPMVVGLSALCSCSALNGQVKEPLVERLDEQGAKIRMFLADGGASLRFINADTHPHQIYSNDCSELSTTVLNPGDTYTATIGNGPKLCHFQDLLAPLATGYFGTVNVNDKDDWLVLNGG